MLVILNNSDMEIISTRKTLKYVETPEAYTQDKTFYFRNHHIKAATCGGFLCTIAVKSLNTHASAKNNRYGDLQDTRNILKLMEIQTCFENVIQNVHFYHKYKEKIAEIEHSLETCITGDLQ